MFLLPLLKTFWAPVAIAVLLAFGYAGFELEQARVDRAQEATALARGNLRVAQADIATLHTQIGDQNKAVADMAETGRVLKLQRDHLLDLAQANGRQTVTNFVTKYKPTPVGVTCAAAVAAGATNAAQVGQLYRSQ